MIDDLFDPKIEDKFTEQRTIDIFNGFIPTSLPEYSKIVINDEISDIIDGNTLNLLSTNTDLLLSVNPKLFKFNNDQIYNLINALSIENTVDDNFIRKVVDENGIIQKIDTNIFISFSTIEDFSDLYKTLDRGIKNREVELLPEQYDLFESNFEKVNTLNNKTSKIKLYLIENLNDIKEKIN